jgi:hypothetical protein
MLTRQQVIGIIGEALEVKGITEASTAENVAEWDSLGHLNILSMLDAATDGAVADITDLAKANSVHKILAILSSRSLLMH